MRRRVAEEALDHLRPEDPAALRSRRDLVRVHRAMGTRATVARAWRALVSPARARQPLRILELGAGDGSLLLGVARGLAPHWPQIHLTLLDRQDIVGASTLAAFAELGWAAQVQLVDVLDWAAQREGAMPGSTPPRWDLITTTLFLHHFEGSQLDELLRAVASRTDRFFACEPRRSWLPLAGSHLVGAIGGNAVTRADAVLSVHAGFRDEEITARWRQVAAQPGEPWHTREFTAGLFSHAFSACRAELD